MNVQHTRRYLLNFGLYTVSALNAPVMLMLFGLPFRQYLCTITLPGFVVIVKQYFAYVDGASVSDGLNTPSKHIFRLAAVCLFVPLLYASCAASVWIHERSQRRLFVLYCALQSKKITLSRDAAFRRYRRIMEANREFFTQNDSHKHADGASDGGGQRLPHNVRRGHTTTTALSDLSIN